MIQNISEYYYAFREFFQTKTENTVLSLNSKSKTMQIKYNIYTIRERLPSFEECAGYSDDPFVWSLRAHVLS